MPGAFEASPEFDDDPLRTAEELQRRGEDVLLWLEQLATSERSRPIDVGLINDVHWRWFESTFPADAGRHRTRMVLNPKGTSHAVEAILPAVSNGCENWAWRREHAPAEEVAQIRAIVAEANTLAITVYDAHPYVDGNTRTTWHLRNYALMLCGLRPLIDLDDQAAYEAAWLGATPHHHDALDRIVITELAKQDR